MEDSADGVRLGELLSLSQIAEMAGVSQRSVQLYVQVGQLSAPVDPSKRWKDRRWRAEDVRRWMAERKKAGLNENVNG